MLVPVFTKIPLQTNLTEFTRLRINLDKKKLENILYKNNFKTIIRFVNNCEYKYILKIHEYK